MQLGDLYGVSPTRSGSLVAHTGGGHVDQHSRSQTASGSGQHPTLHAQPSAFPPSHSASSSELPGAVLSNSSVQQTGSAPQGKMRDGSRELHSKSDLLSRIPQEEMFRKVAALRRTLPADGPYGSNRTWACPKNC